MLLAGDLGREFYNKVRQHYGHKIEVALYGSVDEPENVSIECMMCNEVLLDANRPLWGVITQEGEVRRIISEEWDGDVQEYPTAVVIEDPDHHEGIWVHDSDIPFYFMEEEPVEDYFIEAFGEEEGKKLYEAYVTESTKQWRAETGQDVNDPICPTCFGKGCGDCINEDGGVDR